MAKPTGRIAVGSDEEMEERVPWLLNDTSTRSFGIVADLYARSLGEVGIAPEIRPYPEETCDLALGAAGRLVFHNALCFRQRAIRGARNIALAVHEWSRYRREWVKALNAFDEVWVTTDFVRGVLLDSGVSVPVRWMPPALDPGARLRKVSHEAAVPFRFLSVGEAHFRKGHHLLIEGFLRAFPQPGEATLTIKTSPGCDWVSPRTDIRIVAEEWPREEVLTALAGHDAYASASLGEGLGLPVAEAVLAGLPVVCNRWGGHRSLVPEEGIFAIPHIEVPQVFCSRPEWYSADQQCGYSSPEEIARTLREVVEAGPAERAHRAAVACEYLLGRFGREAVRERMSAWLATTSFAVGRDRLAKSQA